MNKHYIRISPKEVEKGDYYWSPSAKMLKQVVVGSTRKRNDLLYLRLVDSQPANPWIKGSDRLPTEEDAWRNVVEVWNGTAAVYYAFGQVKENDWWRPVDQTPPPAEPTEAELVEELLTTLANEDCGFRARELAKKILAKRESEGRDDQ